jgi:glycosyltransferase involved in cell wall biosynthesis
MRWLRWRKRLVYRAATHLVSASRAGLADLLEVFRVEAEKCRVFYNSLADPLKPARRQPVAPAPFTVVCIGRLFPTKGQDVLLRAAALLKDRLPQLRVELVGDGPSAQALRTLAAELGVARMCHFIGAVNHARVMAHIQAATVTVVPSRSDNNPLVVIESLALGIPVIASSVGGIVESLTDGVEGFLVPPEDPAALAEKLFAVLTQQELRQALGRRARARFLNQFEQDKLLAEQVAWFETRVSPTGPVPRPRALTSQARHAEPEL